MSEDNRDFKAGNWLRDQEWKSFSALSFQLHRMMKKEIGRASRSVSGSEAGVTGRIWSFWIMDQFKLHEAY